MIKELGELNEQFYILCSRLDKYCEKLSDQQHAYMQSVLLEQYKAEYKLLALKCGIETQRATDEFQAKYDRLVPHRWRFWGFLWRKKNYAAVLNDAKADEYAARTFAEIEARILAETRARCAAGATDGVPGEVAEELTEERKEGEGNAGSSSEGGQKRRRFRNPEKQGRVDLRSRAAHNTKSLKTGTSPTSSGG